MKLVPHSKGTIAKISALVTIFVIEHLIVAKKGKIGPSKLFANLACHQNYVAFICKYCPMGKRPVPKFQSWSQFLL